MGAWEATDPNTADGSDADVTVTRFYSAGGVQLASKTTGGSTLVTLGDVQGSAQVTVDGSGQVARNAYTPYGVKRAGSNVASAHGWLNQIADADTGLTYLNARYYDPALGRFLSPDPLMNPGDPRTLDPYRYADNNPVVYMDSAGLAPSCAGATGKAYENCAGYVNSGYNYSSGESKAQVASRKQAATYSNVRSNYSPSTGASPLHDAIDYFGSDTARVSAAHETQVLLGATGQYGGTVVGGVFSGGARCVGGAVSGCLSGGGTAAMEPISGAVIVSIALEQREFWATGGQNDLKVGLSNAVAYSWGEDRNKWIQDSDGSRIRQDVFGNVQFGAIYRMANVPLKDALAAANSGGAAGVADPVDDVAVELGYTLFETYPSGASPLDLQGFFRSPGTRAKLLAAGLYAPAG